jgi:hypothetical protein
MKITITSLQTCEQEVAAALKKCNLCKEQLVLSFAKDVLFWGDDYIDLIDALQQEIEENVERGGGYMLDAYNFSITGEDLYNIFDRITLE